MNVQLVSEDNTLLVLCREIAKEFPATNWQFRGGVNAAGSDLDLSLWDYRVGLSIPENQKWGSRSFVLVRAQDLVPFRKAHPYAETGIVLKPVTRAVVRALMAQAVASRAQRAQTDTESIRADRDDILQFLMEANLQLQQYDADRTNFLSRALHDFQAPLTALSGYCDLLAEGKIGSLEDRQKLVIRRMHHSVRRLSRMSKAMFNLSVGRHIALKADLREGDIRDCAEQALYEVQQLAEEKAIQLDIDFEPSLLSFDSGQIEQALVNLLENAYKFTPRYGSIFVRGYRYFWDRRAGNVFCPAESDRRAGQVNLPNAYRVDIGDSGPGISPEHLKLIFEEYVSYSGGQDRSRGGLGLAICRMILNQHQGRIWAENGQSGAVFSFVLPLPPADDVGEVSGHSTRSELARACV